MHHDRLVASVAFLDGGRSDSTRLVETTESGWWYSAALPDQRFPVTAIFDAPLPWDPSEQTRTRIQRGGYATRGPVRRVAAGSARLDRIGGDGWLAIGDAVMAVDPIASRGLIMSGGGAHAVRERGRRGVHDTYAQSHAVAHVDRRRE